MPMSIPDDDTDDELTFAGKLINYFAIGLLIVFAIVFLFVFFGKFLADPCNQMTDPPIPDIYDDVQKCLILEMFIGEEVILTAGQARYQIILTETMVNDLPSVRLAVFHPNYVLPFRYYYVVTDQIADTIAVGEIAMQRQQGRYFLRYPPGWQVIPQGG